MLVDGINKKKRMYAKQFQSWTS